MTIELDASPVAGLAHPFLRPGGAPAELRRTHAARLVSWVLVGVLHVLLFTVLVVSIRPFSERNRPVIETLMMLPSLGNNPNAPPLRTVDPDIENSAPPLITTAPITIPEPIIPPDSTGREAAPGDILRAVGRELACDAGSWEHLTMVERQRCGLYPWRGARLPNGALVMVPRNVLPRLREPSAETEFRVNSGADRIGSDVRTGIIPGQGGCPILQNTPCLHVSPGMRAATGNN